MDGLDVGTLVATLKLVDEMTPALSQAGQQTTTFAQTVEASSQQTNVFAEAMKSTASSATEAAVQQTVLATSTKNTAVASTEAAVATTALATQTHTAIDAKKMFADMVQQANDRLDNEAKALAVAAESTSVFDVALTGVGTALGLVTIALIAFGPPIYELIGGWEGLKSIMAETGEVFADLANIIEPFTDHVLNAFVQGITAAIGVLPALGGAIVDVVVAAAELTGVTLLFERLRDVIGAMAAEGALADLADDVDDLQTSMAGLNGQTLSFGIDPEDTDAVNAYAKEVDDLIRKGDPARASFDELKGSINATSMVFETLTSAQIRNLGGVVELTAAEKRHIEQMREMEVVGEEALVKASKQVVTFDAMRQALEAMVSPLTISTATMKEFNAAADFDKMRVQLEAFNSPLSVSADFLREVNAEADFDAMAAQLEIAGGHTKSFADNVLTLSQSFFVLGNAIPGVIGDVLKFAATTLQTITTIRVVVDAVKTAINSFASGGFDGVTSGIAAVAQAAAAALPIVISIGSAIKRAFTSEETELVNPNRDLFTAQFMGAETDPFQAIGNSTIRAAMQVYGVDWDTAWNQYAEPLVRALQEADTYPEFLTAQRRIAELFKQAGVTLDIYNEAGQGTQYRSSVFEGVYGWPGGSFPIPNLEDLPDWGKEVTGDIGDSVLGGDVWGGPYGGSFPRPTTGGMGVGCFYIENLYVNGTNGQQQAKSFFDALYDYITTGGDALSKWRQLNCAAGAA